MRPGAWRCGSGRSSGQERAGGVGPGPAPRSYLEDEAVVLVLGVHGRQPVLALPGDVHLVSRERVAGLPELLDLGLEDLLEPLVFQLCALYLLLQLCGGEAAESPPRGATGAGARGHRLRGGRGRLTRALSHQGQRTSRPTVGTGADGDAAAPLELVTLRPEAPAADPTAGSALGQQNDEGHCRPAEPGLRGRAPGGGGLQPGVAGLQSQATAGPEASVMATERCAAWAQAGPGDGVGPSALCPALHCARAQVTCTELGDPGGRCALWPSRAR